MRCSITVATSVALRAHFGSAEGALLDKAFAEAFLIQPAMEIFVLPLRQEAGKPDHAVAGFILQLLDRV